MKKKRVLLLGKLPPPYMGPAIATQILLNSSLKEHYHLLHLDTRLNLSLDTMGQWNPAKLWRNAVLYVRLLKICLVNRPDLVLIPISQSSTGFLKDFGFILVCKITGRKVVLQLRGSNFKNWMSGAPKYIRGIVRKAMHWSEGMIVLGQKLRSLFEPYFPPDRIFVIPNGGNFSFPVVPKTGSRFLYFSNLFEAKGITDVIDAIKLLKDEGINGIHLDIAGKWLEASTKKYCEDQVSQYHLPVTFFPPLSGKEKLERFAAADVFLFPPREPEGHPWVIVEALAAGLPVIATDKGAITESVIDGQNGWIVQDKNPADLAEKMKRLLPGSSQKDMGARSRELYEQNFTEEKMVEKYVQCFNSLLDGKK